MSNLSRQHIDHASLGSKIFIVTLHDDSRPRSLAHDHALFFTTRRSYVADKTIATLRHSLNVVFAFMRLAECFSQYGNVLREVVFLDKTVRPHLLHQILLRHHVTGVFEQHEQRVEDFRRERHLAILFEEEALGYVNSKAVK